MNEAVVETTKSRRINAIWLLPIAVVVIGAWVTVQHYLAQGPEVTVTFKTAEGLEAGRTKVRSLDVDVGTVELVQIDDDLKSVTITVQMNPGTRKLLHADSQFWVVRPRINAEGVSGLGTLLSGAYVELQPGNGRASEPKLHFTGLEERPRTPPGVAGVRISLSAESAGSVTAGAPVLYQGLKVGQLESVDLDVDSSKFTVSAFINAPYDKLITDRTKFWNASGFSVEANAQGIKVSTASLAALIAGGVAFDLPESHDNATPVKAGTTFRLYPSEQAARLEPFQYSKEYVLRFSQSLRGLAVGAPVEYRGIQVGTVQQILRSSLGRGDGKAYAVPVVIKVEPSQFGLPDDKASLDKLEDIVRASVGNGLHATLQTGNLISGQLYVSFDFYSDKEPKKIEKYDGYDVLPTLPSGIQRLEQQLHAILEKVNNLPFEQLGNDLSTALSSASGAMASVQQLVSSDDVNRLPKRMDATLVAAQKAIKTLQRTAASYAGQSELQTSIIGAVQELEMTLRRVREFVAVLEDKPNALVFPPTQEPDPIPKASQ